MEAVSQSSVGIALSDTVQMSRDPSERLMWKESISSLASGGLDLGAQVVAPLWVSFQLSPALMVARH